MTLSTLIFSGKHFLHQIVDRFRHCALVSIRTRHKGTQLAFFVQVAQVLLVHFSGRVLKLVVILVSLLLRRFQSLAGSSDVVIQLFSASLLCGFGFAYFTQLPVLLLDLYLRRTAQPLMITNTFKKQTMKLVQV